MQRPLPHAFLLSPLPAQTLRLPLQHKDSRGAGGGMPMLGALENCCILCLEASLTALPSPSLPQPLLSHLQTPCPQPAQSAPSKACITGPTLLTPALSLSALAPSLSSGKDQDTWHLRASATAHVPVSLLPDSSTQPHSMYSLLSEFSNSHHSDTLPGQPTAVPSLRPSLTPARYP